uniref:OSJNBa0065B15.12 protein n=1 Tax=Oryza sativa subsp. japonica TaxID=39947 RepID=Q7XWT9_ORYSJ|nr:OSJNBa0065B15.12 [Oryza sativa Japonica Group]
MASAPLPQAAQLGYKPNVFSFWILYLQLRLIDYCKNEHMTYSTSHTANMQEYADLDVYPVCGASRYKRAKSAGEGSKSKRGGPANVVWYLPIAERMKRMFANKEQAKLVRWHAEERKVDSMLRHPADSVQWRTIDRIYQEFSNDPKNMCFAMCTDGINPFGDLSSRHSTWPVLLVNYNLPPWLCFKRKYIMLAMLIQGPRQPGNDIDVFLEPIIDDFERLWNEGTRTWDAYAQEYFNLHAMLLCTINDYPALGNLSGQTVKEKWAYSECMEETKSKWLKHSHKTVYMGHRRFLPRKVGKTKEKSMSKEKTEEHVKKQKTKERSMWKKKSIFWRLPYWKDLEVRHCIDLMHVEKNKIIDPEGLDELQAELVRTLCHLEMYFPQTFFDIMEHLPVHLVRQTKCCGPALLTQMYPCERYLGILKGYVRNRSHPEGSIIESYTIEEVINFCVDYMSETSSIGLPRSHHKGMLDGVGTVERKTVRLDGKVYDKAHFTQDSKCTVQNSGLRIEAASDGGRRDQYYGRVEQILELDYLKFKVPLFRCRWVDLRNVKVDNEGFTTVNLANNVYKDEPFVLAKQVVQVFYIVDPCNKKLHVVREGKRGIVGLDNIEEDDYNQHVHGIGQEIPLEEEEEEDNVQYARVDHEEGLFL